MQPFQDFVLYYKKHLSEEQLIKEIKNNPVLFEKIYNQHYTTIFNYCYRRTGDFDTSKDITSESFLKAYLNIHGSKKYKPKLLYEIYSESFISRNIKKLEEEKSKILK